MDSKVDTLTRRGLFGRLFGAVVAAVAAPLVPARWYQRGLEPQTLGSLGNAPVTLAPYTGTATLWIDGQWFIVDFDASHATSDPPARRS